MVKSIMINKFLYSYKSLVTNQARKSFIPCVSIDKKESMLLLINPQIVHSSEEINKPSNNGFSDLNTSFNDIVEASNSNNTAFSEKFDKKNKNNIQLLDPLEIKKNKLKQKKKNRSKINLEHDEVVLNKNQNMKVDSETLAMSLMRPHNPNKQKKRKRFKIESSVDQLSLSKPVAEKEKFNISNKEIVLDNPLTIQELSEKLKIPVAEIITWLFLKGISVTINQVVDTFIATEVAKNYDFKVLGAQNNYKNQISIQTNEGIKRAPIITLFGHVDHGKTTLLDKIRKTNLVNQEAGGITQTIAGYEVEWKENDHLKKLIFLDTPGHEAFAGMRLRGAQVTDLAVLVVAADDGLKPQTLEAIDYIINKKLPFIVAINKIDKDSSNIDKVKRELAEHDIIGQDLGGNISIVEISALTGYNIDKLLSNLCILSDLKDLRSDPSKPAEGTILEAHLDKQKGAVANILIQNGTLRVGDIIISDNISGKVKVIIDNNRKKINNVQSTSIVEIWGFSSVPNAGSNIKVLKDEKTAKQIISEYVYNNESITKTLNSRVTLDSYINKSIPKQVNLILKTDTQGSIIINAFAQIPQEKVQINILSANSGQIADKDIELALTSNSIVLGFNVSLSSNIRNTVEQSGVLIKEFNVIYDLLNYIQEYMLNFVNPEYDKLVIGNATVQTVFSINKGSVAGCLVNSGKLKKQAYITIYRNKIVVYDGILSSLKHLKDDVDEVHALNECGVMCSNYHLWEKKDFIEAYELNQKERTL